jgi:hypothetical protein
MITSKAEELQQMTMTMADQQTFNFKKRVFDCTSEKHPCKSIITAREAAQQTVMPTEPCHTI